MAMQQNPNLLMTGQQPCQPNNLLNATNSTQSSNNFYENTMHSDTSSLHKRKSVISSQSTGSSNNEVHLFVDGHLRYCQKNTTHNFSSRFRCRLRNNYNDRHVTIHGTAKSFNRLRCQIQNTQRAPTRSTHKSYRTSMNIKPIWVSCIPSKTKIKNLLQN